MFKEETIKAGILSALHKLTEGKVDLNNRLGVNFYMKSPSRVYYSLWFDDVPLSFESDLELEDFDSYHLQQFNTIAETINSFISIMPRP
jgi:hypothetical protein